MITHSTFQFIIVLVMIHDFIFHCPKITLVRLVIPVLNLPYFRTNYELAPHYLRHRNNCWYFNICSLIIFGFNDYLVEF